MGKKSSLPALSTTLKSRFQEAKVKTESAEDFLRHFLMQFISDETKRAYAKDLESFFEFLREGEELIREPRDIKPYHFQLYRDVMLEKKYASATINRRLVAVRSFMKWALSARLIENNPLDLVKLPRAQTEEPTEAFDDDEVVKMIAAPDTSTYKGSLHRLMLVMLFHLGLRRSELSQIKLGDIIQDRGHVVLKILGKGSKYRYLPLSKEMQNEINAHLERVKKFNYILTKTDYLFKTDLKNKKPIDGSNIYRMLVRYARQCGITKRVSPHSCRATVISHLLDTQHTPIRDVAIFAGHSQITTTERYDKRRQNLDQSAAYQVEFEEKKKEKKVS
jgi:integrase/recombinase XerD